VAIDPVQLAKDQLDVFFTKDPGLEGKIPRQVEAQAALEGWTVAGLTDPQAVYVSALAVDALLFRLIGVFTDEIKKAKGGTSEAEFQDLLGLAKLMQQQCQAGITRAAKEVKPADNLDPYRPPAYPKPGVRKI
jgi:hypothetical protein